MAANIAAGAYALWAMLLAGGSSTAVETQTATTSAGSEKPREDGGSGANTVRGQKEG
jgi:hypothetical protein